MNTYVDVYTLINEDNLSVCMNFLFSLAILVAEEQGLCRFFVFFVACSYVSSACLSSFYELS